jgi:hypothetical protein
MLIVWGPGRQVLANDDPAGEPGRALLGTTGWNQYEIVADIPPETEEVNFGVKMRGKGSVWVDQMQIEVVGDDVPTTDDSRWHPWSFNAGKYSATLDGVNVHNNHPTICIQSTGSVLSGGKNGDWVAYDHNDRHVEELRGKRVRLTAAIKCEGVTVNAGPSIRAHGAAYAVLARDNSFPRRPVHGTAGWQKYSVYLDVPEQTQDLCWGFIINGKGKIWVDEVTYEVVPK